MVLFSGAGQGERPVRSLGDDPAEPPAAVRAATSAVPAVALLLADSGAASDTDYRVPGDAVVVAPDGDPDAAGTADDPLNSIAAAVRRARSGGVVVLRGGVYREGSIEVDEPMTLQAWPHEKPVISGADVVREWKASGDAWVASSWRTPFGQKQYRADEIPEGSAAGLVEQAYRDGRALTQVLARDDLRPGTFWVDGGTGELWLGDDPAGARIELSSRERAITLKQDAEGSKVLGLRFTAFAGPHLDNGAQLYVSSPGTVIENSTFDHGSSAGLKLAATGITVEHNTMADNAAEGMNGNRTHGTTVRNNQFLRNNTDRFKSEGCGTSCTVAGFKAAHTDDLTVEDNAFIDNNGANGIWCDLGCTNTTITGNVVTGSYDAIFFEVSSHGVITDNWVADSDKGIRVSGSDHVLISRNTLSDNHWQLTVYDDRRLPSTDAYSHEQGLTWDTAQVTVSGNTFDSGAATERLLEGESTDQVSMSRMFAKWTGNTYVGRQVMQWCTGGGEDQCRSYPSIESWRSASGLGF